MVGVENGGKERETQVEPIYHPCKSSEKRKWNLAKRMQNNSHIVRRCSEILKMNANVKNTL